MKKTAFLSTSVILLLLASLPLVVQAATPTIYYVDATGGDDTHDGLSAGTAWKTLNQVNNFSFIAGDTILFKRGEIWHERLVPSTDGDAGSPITYRAYGQSSLGMPVISGGNSMTGAWTNTAPNIWRSSPALPQTDCVSIFGVTGTAVASLGALQADYQWFQAASAPYYIYIHSPANPNVLYAVEYAARSCIENWNDCPNLSFDSLEMCLGTPAFRSGMDNTKVLNCYAWNCTDGIDVDASNCQIMGNTVCSMAGDCIVVDGDNNTISANYCSNAYVGIEMSGNGGILSNNFCQHCNHGGVGLWIGGFNNASNGVIINNENYDCDWGISLADGICTNMLVYKNRVYGSVTAGLEFGDSPGGIRCHDNLLYGNSTGIFIFGNGQGTLIENNVLYGNGYGLDFEDDSCGYIFRNNIYANNANRDFNYSGTLNPADHINNCYFRPTPSQTSVDVYLTKTAQNFIYSAANITNFEPTAFNSDPKFSDPAATVADFHLLPSSPLIDKGTALGTYLYDFDGISVPLGLFPEIGAFEYVLTPHMLGLSWKNVPIKTLLINSQGSVVGQIQCSAYQYDQLVSMTVTNLGTAVSGTDLSALRLLYAPDGNSLTAITVGTFTPKDAKTWSLSGLSHRADDKGWYFLAVDVAAAAQLSRVCCFSLPANQAFFQSARYLPQATISNIDNQIINDIIFNNADVSVDLSSSSRVRVVKGEKQVPLAQISLANLITKDIALGSLRLGLQTPEGRNLDPGSALGSVQLLQNNAVLCSLAPPFGQNLLFTFPQALTLSAQAQNTFQVQGDIAAAPTANRFCLAVLDNQCINGGQPLSQAAAGKAFPLVTNPISIREAQLAATFSNYPNPFSPSEGGTKIGYYLPKDAQIKLTIWTLDHRLVKTLTDARQPAGMQEIPWDGRNGQGNQVRNGVYLLALDCTYVAGGHESFTRKIAVAK